MSDASDDYTVTLSPDAYRMICGLVNGTEVIDPDYVIGDSWEEVRAAFPVSGYADLPTSSDGVPNGGFGSAFINARSYAGPMMA